MLHMYHIKLNIVTFLYGKYRNCGCRILDVSHCSLIFHKILTRSHMKYNNKIKYFDCFISHIWNTIKIQWPFNHVLKITCHAAFIDYICRNWITCVNDDVYMRTVYFFHMRTHTAGSFVVKLVLNLRSINNWKTMIRNWTWLFLLRRLESKSLNNIWIHE